MHNIRYQKLACGLQVVTETIQGVRTAALNWGIRAGVASNTHDGDSVLLAELVLRGAGDLSAKEHNDALDLLGVRRNVTCGVQFFHISGMMLGSHLLEAIPLLGGYILHPSLHEQDLPACKSLCMQSIQSLADNPSHRAGIALNTYHQPSPFNRSTYGELSCITSSSIERLRSVYEQTFVPEDSILVIAGDVDHQQCIDVVEQVIGRWNGSNKPPQLGASPCRGYHWIEQDSSQVHIGFAFDAPNATDQHAILESVAISVFGGATSGRLFTEVRQRRSLCYSVGAQYASSRDRSVVRVSAGTTPERADETVNVCLDQLMKLRDGITKDEFNRTVQQMKSRTVMRGESTTARANAIWGDQYALGCARSLADRLHEIDAVTHEAVNSWLKNRDFGQLTLVSLGPKAVKFDETLL